MITTKQNFTRTKGDNYPIKISIKKDKTDPLDITGATLTLKVLRGQLETYTANIVDAENGIAEFLFTEDSFDSSGSFKYEIELVTASGIKYTVATGTFNIIKDLD